MNLKQIVGSFLGASIAWSSISLAAVNVDRTRIIMSTDQKSVSVLLTNESRDTPYLAQAWIEDSGGAMINDLLALPPLQRIDAGKKAQVRITQINPAAAASLPQDRESLFYFNVREIPPAPADQNASILQLTTQSQLKLFLRPAALPKNDNVSPEQSLQVQVQDNTLTLKNPTPYYATVIWLGQNRTQRLPGFDAAAMVAPYSELALQAELPADTRQLILGNIDDYGGLRMSRYACQAGQCLFQEKL